MRRKLESVYLTAGLIPSIISELKTLGISAETRSQQTEEKFILLTQVIILKNEAALLVPCLLTGSNAEIAQEIDDLVQKFRERYCDDKS
jgi:hypothetical protein